MAKGGLGKGLDALLGDTALHSQEGSLYLPISQVQPGLNQPRKRFDDASIYELADSIRIHGIIQPLTVRRLSSGYYQIIAGERRWRAAKQIGLTEVPAVVIEADEREVLELGLIENLQREDLNPVEEAHGYHVLMEQYDLTQEEVAQRVGKSRPAVANALRLLELPDVVLHMLEEGRITSGHARAILGATDDKSIQRELAIQIEKNHLSVRQVEALARKLSQKHGPGEHLGVDPHKMYRDAVARELTDRFGRKVSILEGRKKGTLVMEYYNDADLDTLLSLLEQINISAPATFQPRGEEDL